MTLSYQDLMATKRTSIKAEITTDHPASHYSQPVIVLPDGGCLDYQSAILLNYRIERATEAERELLAKWQRNMPPLDPISTGMRALRAIPSDKRAAASRANGAKGDPESHRRGGRHKTPKQQKSIEIESYA